MRVRDLTDWINVEYFDNLTFQKSQSHPRWYRACYGDGEDVIFSPLTSVLKPLWFYLILNKIAPLPKDIRVDEILPTIDLNCRCYYMHDNTLFDIIEVFEIDYFNSGRMRALNPPQYFKRTKKNKPKEIGRKEFVKKLRKCAFGYDDITTLS